MILYFQVHEIEVASESPARPNLDSDEFKRIFQKATDKAAHRLENDKLLNNPRSRYDKDILKIVLFCSTISFIAFCTEHLLEHFYSIFITAPVKCREREILFSKFHVMRCDERIRTDFIKGICIDCDKTVKCLFYQKFLDFLLECILAEMLNFYSSSDSFSTYISDETEQKVLFYISGFIVKKLEILSSKRLLKFQNIIRSFHDKSLANMEFAKKEKSWTVKLDRGGLKYPCKYFYFLVREIDFCVNSNVDFNNIKADSLCPDYLFPIIIESYMIKHYFKLLIEGEEDDCELLLRHIIKLFLTVKVFAIARKTRNALCFKRNLNSLRGGMKK